MKIKMKKAVICVGILMLIIIPVIFAFVLGKRNSIYKETAEYMEYLYFNWIDYPKKAEKKDIFSEDANREILSWFGYDEEGTPLPERYYDIDFKYNGKFIFEDDYIAVPFEDAGQTYYRKIMLNDGKVVEINGSLWEK